MRHSSTYGLRAAMRKFKRVATVGASKLVGHFDPLKSIVLSSKTIHGWISGADAEEMVRLAYESPENAVIVEIGAWMGRSTTMMAAARRLRGNGKVYSIDPFDCSGDDFSVKHYVDELALTGSNSLEDVFKANLQKKGVEKWVEVLKGKGEDFARQWTKPIDLLLLDADHSEEGARTAFDHWTPFLKKGGIIILANIWDTKPQHNGNHKLFTEQVVAPAFHNIRRIEYYGVAERAG
jgi:MMP 1-O-methyltransferase